MFTCVWISGRQSRQEMRRVWFVSWKYFRKKCYLIEVRLGHRKHLSWLRKGLTRFPYFFPLQLSLFWEKNKRSCLFVCALTRLAAQRWPGLFLALGQPHTKLKLKDSVHIGLAECTWRSGNRQSKPPTLIDVAFSMPNKVYSLDLCLNRQ